MEKLILKLIWQSTGPRIAKNNFEKKNKLRGIILPKVKTYCMFTIINDCGIEGSMQQKREPRTQQICQLIFLKSCKSSSIKGQSFQ